jgi:hypothetical protein
MKENIASKLPFTPTLNVSERLRSPFPYYLNDDRKNLLIILAISTFVVFFMLVYRPVRNFEEELTIGKTSIFGGVTFVVLTISIIVLPKLFPVVFDPTNWTIQKYLLQTLAQCFVIGVVSVFIDKLYICPQKSIGEITVHAFSQVALKRSGV